MNRAAPYFAIDKLNIEIINRTAKDYIAKKPPFLFCPASPSPRNPPGKYPIPGFVISAAFFFLTQLI